MRYLTGKIEDRRIRIKVGISPVDPSEPSSLRYEEFLALVDTGALRTCVTQKVVDKLGLKRRGRIEVSNVKRRDLHWTYLFYVAIWPNSADGNPVAPFGIGDEVEGIDVGDSRYFDILLGMDIISRGEFELSLDGSFRFGFPG